MHTSHIEYSVNGVTLEGFLAFDDSHDKPRPAILIAHAWAGRDSFECDKAKMLAELGYVAFAVDNYGKGKLGTSVEENTALMTPLMEDRGLLLQRMQGALETIKVLDVVDNNRIGAIGFCFGGLTVLDFARSGADIKGAVSFHGLLDAPDNFPTKPIQSKILVLHGYDDPMATPDQVNVFEAEMTAAKADWQLIAYGNTMHAFTNPSANDASMGLMYNPVTEKRALQAMRNFFEEVL